MTAEEVCIIPKDEAVLCENCDNVSNRQPDGRCAHCGSEATLNLTAITERKE